MHSAIGFTAIRRGFARMQERAASAQQKALANFPKITQRCVHIGDTTISWWGRDDLESCARILPDKSWLFLAGSPVGTTTLDAAARQIAGCASLVEYRLPWDGRALLLHVSADGNHWTLWNDWLGSIPVYHTVTPQACVLSTLEPVVVAANRFSSANFSLPAILHLFIHGHFLSDWTLYREMKVVPPDSVTTWCTQGSQTLPCETIPLSAERWERGWDDLVDEMHALTRQAILDALRDQPFWVLPLSGGLDSRLIAAVASAEGIPMKAYTWGQANSKDAIYACQIARTLNLPWKRVDLGSGYLERHARNWADLFGSAMHFHGMYQIAFLEAIKQEVSGKLASGFLGDSLGGYTVRFLSEFHVDGEMTYYGRPQGWLHWSVEELKALFKQPIATPLEQVAAEIACQRRQRGGAWFQQLKRFADWSRQRHFTYFQAMLSDYWQGIATPFLNREYARFSYSLPRLALDDRRLQIDMMQRYYNRTMMVGGTYTNQPTILTGGFIMKRRAAMTLPKTVVNHMLPEFASTYALPDNILSLIRSGEAAIWPIPDARKALGEFFHLDQLDAVYRSAMAGNSKSLRQMQCVQALAYRMIETS